MEYIFTILTFTGITLIGVLGSYLVTGLTGLSVLVQGPTRPHKCGNQSKHNHKRGCYDGGNQFAMRRGILRIRHACHSFTAIRRATIPSKSWNPVPETVFSAMSVQRVRHPRTSCPKTSVLSAIWQRRPRNSSVPNAAGAARSGSAAAPNAVNGAPLRNSMKPVPRQARVPRLRDGPRARNRIRSHRPRRGRSPT